MVKTKVLFLIETLGVGGAEKSLLQILPRLRKVDVLLCHLFATNPMKSDFQRAGVEVVSLNIHPCRFSAAIRPVRKIVRDWAPDIIHGTLYHADICGRLIGFTSRNIVVSSIVNDNYSKLRLRGLDRAGGIKVLLYKFIDRITSNVPSRFLANSNAVADAYSRAVKVSRDRISVIYRGRDAKLFRTNRSDSTKQHILAELGIGFAGPIVLNVGRLVKTKGQDTLITAFHRLLKHNPNAILLIAGEGPERGYLLDRIRFFGVESHVRLLGVRDDIPSLLSACDVFAFPSYLEGHPGALVEAMMAACPIVATAIANNAEMIRPNQTGLLVPIDDADALASSLSHLLNSPQLAQRLGLNAQTVATEKYEISSVSRQYDNFYTDLVLDQAKPNLKKN
jgi:glycosyltransferase involved in cell wall biosynthesis